MMTTSQEDIVRQWLFEYSCRHNLARAISECSRIVSLWTEQDCAIPQIFIIMASMQSVIEQKDVERYPHLIQLLSSFYENCSNLIPARLYLQADHNIKVLILLDMLAKKNHRFLLRLNSYFPRTGTEVANADVNFMKKMKSEVLQLRRCFLKMVSCQDVCESYLSRGRFNSFQIRSEKLIKSLVDLLNSSLPVSAIDQILQAGPDSTLFAELGALQCPAVELLLDVLSGRDRITDTDVIELLRTLDYNQTSDLDNLQNVFTCRSAVGIGSPGAEPLRPSDELRPVLNSSNESSRIPNAQKARSAVAGSSRDLQRESDEIDRVMCDLFGTDSDDNNIQPVGLHKPSDSSAAKIRKSEDKKNRNENLQSAVTSHYVTGKRNGIRSASVEPSSSEDESDFQRERGKQLVRRTGTGQRRIKVEKNVDKDVVISITSSEESQEQRTGYPVEGIVISSGGTPDVLLGCTGEKNGDIEYGSSQIAKQSEAHLSRDVLQEDNDLSSQRSVFSLPDVLPCSQTEEKQANRLSSSAPSNLSDPAEYISTSQDVPSKKDSQFNTKSFRVKTPESKSIHEQTVLALRSSVSRNASGCGTMGSSKSVVNNPVASNASKEVMPKLHPILKVNVEETIPVLRRIVNPATEGSVDSGAGGGKREEEPRVGVAKCIKDRDAGRLYSQYVDVEGDPTQEALSLRREGVERTMPSSQQSTSSFYTCIQNSQEIRSVEVTANETLNDEADGDSEDDDDCSILPNTPIYTSTNKTFLCSQPSARLTHPLKDDSLLASRHVANRYKAVSSFEDSQSSSIDAREKSTGRSTHSILRSDQTSTRLPSLSLISRKRRTCAASSAAQSDNGSSVIEIPAGVTRAISRSLPKEGRRHYGKPQDVSSSCAGSDSITLSTVSTREQSLTDDSDVECSERAPHRKRRRRHPADLISYIGESVDGECSSPEILPSSHSFDRFDAVCGINRASTLPIMERHLRHPLAPNPAVVVLRLRRRKTSVYNEAGNLVSIKIYS